MSQSPSPNAALSEFLARALPESLTVTAYEIASLPTKCTSLFLAPPGESRPQSTRETTFVGVSYQGSLVFGIEVLVYADTLSRDCTLFISKADSTGHFPSEKSSFVPAFTMPRVKNSVLRSIATAVVDYIVKKRRINYPDGKITVALFARSQPQYLFTNSGSNGVKHVLSDQSLISWWCKTLNPLHQRYFRAGNSKAYLLVPGSDRLQVKKLFPPRGAEDEAEWIHGHPFSLDAAKNITVREAIPHFPDDPKARFLDDLNGEEFEKCNKRSHKWAGIQTIDQFWEMMSYRQECSAGRSVGFIWLVIDPSKAASPGLSALVSPIIKESKSDPKSELQTTSDPTEETPSTNVVDAPESKSNIETAPPKRRPSPPRKRSSSLVDLLLSPKKKARMGTPTGTTAIMTSDYSISLDDKRYHRMIESLLVKGDFSSLETSRSSTKKWLNDLYMLASGTNVKLDSEIKWGKEVKGTIPVQAADANAGSDTAASAVNLLIPRKGNSTPAINAPVVNTLGAGLIRKKKKED